ncbi:MAG: hypothetical protein NTV94_14385 [Planctomycetota bacterium]|nr:hypothetical protein [Planctomycetota bacterium]
MPMSPDFNSIDIDRLTETQLRDLHARITERIRFIQHARAHRAMMEISLGARVMFEGHSGMVLGTVIKYNRKTVSVVSDTGTRWTVSPSLLTVLEPATKSASGHEVVVTVDALGQSASQPRLG